ncbi:MAG: hypothetical protein FH751_10650 [Firmicutes bacterium]|nr:hypothetical protein [Bacillota bacterium]
MNRLNPDKLFVEYRPYVTETEPIIPRRYTLTHSDITADLFLTIGTYYAFDKINEMRDEVLAEWRIINGKYTLYGYVYVGGENIKKELAALRFNIFNRELPLALEAIVYGDRNFFNAHPKLIDAPIIIYFDSYYEEFNKVKYFKTPRDYK